VLIRALRLLISAEPQTQRSITLHGQILYEHHQNNNYQETSRYPLERVRTTLGGDIAGIILDPLAHRRRILCSWSTRSPLFPTDLRSALRLIPLGERTVPTKDPVFTAAQYWLPDIAAG
jgi:hypothetical protein